MTFNFPAYFLFLPCVYLLFRLAGHSARWVVLLAASFSFYAALKVPYLPALLLLVGVIAYCFGIWIERQQGAAGKLALLWAGIAGNLTLLIACKYLPHLLQSPTVPGAGSYPAGEVKGFVVIGVSYYIFQAISYLCDVYFEMEKPERHFGYFMLYLAFFPKLLQGPIERVGDLLPQLKAGYRFDYDKARLGLVLFAWGLLKKVVIADRLAPFVNGVYDHVQAATPLASLAATYAYAFEIYFDFSGYTDMALGSALLFNVRLTNNFDRPYLATSVADFWRRWHISFSRWLLDYIFRPLQMQWRRAGVYGTAAALMVTFLVSGLWHGTRWGFVVWGALHGVYLACSVCWRPWQKKLHRALSVEKSLCWKCWCIFVTFNLVSFAWIFFRAGSLGNAFAIIRNIAGLSLQGITAGYLRSTVGSLITQADLGILLLCALFSITLALCRLPGDDFGRLFLKGALPRWSFYLALSLMIILLARMTEVPFLYFQF